ncbi:hypothetical protein GQ43DRAFT_215514 [Delitschia confertaspora ATCC 74209]|uniref:Hydantoin racemase n=1 Tax=Delitschia confertaspora ATCC 74209 TaxID=1513339 RepID=A0A9P4JD64_9PLEO|nr:hypothetical protein GQ43DRAFT_215514 [Delitschia confertaspora ATCC 74209]
MRFIISTSTVSDDVIGRATATTATSTNLDIRDSRFPYPTCPSPQLHCHFSLHLATNSRMGELKYIQRTITSTMRDTRSILVINPNSTESMTDALRPLVESLHYKDTTHDFFTAPSGPKSINDEDDAVKSVKHCLPALEPILERYSGFLVACYSEHPLVPILKRNPSIRKGRKYVTGIFEASVGTSLQIISPDEKFGIVSTGKVWEKILSEATANLLGTGTEASKRFAGVETTGLNATDLHDAPPEEVRKRMKDAVKRLLRKGKVGAICLGCAGMSGMDKMVREACVEELGEEEGSLVRIVDGVQAGVAWLEGSVRAGL